MSAAAEDLVGTGAKIVALVQTAGAAEICLAGAVAEQEFGNLVAVVAGIWVAGQVAGAAAEVVGAAGQVAAEIWAAAAAGCSVSVVQAQQTP